MTDRLPVYEVVAPGIDEPRARRLAKALNIADEALVVRNGAVGFIDPSRYLGVPFLPAPDSEATRALLDRTTNHFPDIPLEIRGIEIEELRRWTPLEAAEAVRRATEALAASELTPEHAKPVVGHTVLKTVSLRESHDRWTTSTELDTHVSFRFDLDGYLLVGPGAQVQVNYDRDGTVTRLFHSTRVLAKGSSVPLVPVEELRRRLACNLEDAELNIRLVYWTPPVLSPMTSPSAAVSSILPWYAVGITRWVRNLESGKIEPRRSRVHLLPATDDPRFVPMVTLSATEVERSLVEAQAAVTGGVPPYTYFWAGSDPDASATTSASVRYTPRVRDYREVAPSRSFRRIEQVSLSVVDANGVRVHAGAQLAVTAQPAVATHSSVTYGCESPNDPGPSPTDGSYAPERIAWQNAMAFPGQGGGTQRFCWLADDSWPGDFIEPKPAGSLQPSPWINGDADYANWGINTANLVLYNGDGWPGGFAEMYPGATLADYNASGGASLGLPNANPTVQIGSQGYDVPYPGMWGAPHPDDRLQWLTMYACQNLEDDASNPTPWQRWGPAFNGLHSFLAFESEASDNGVGFMTDFPESILGVNLLGIQIWPAQTIVQAWLSTALSNQMGTPAAMGPIEFIDDDDDLFAICDFGDYYWGKGHVGPTLSAPEINGWWYIQGTDALQEFP